MIITDFVLTFFESASFIEYKEYQGTLSPQFKGAMLGFITHVVMTALIV